MNADIKRKRIIYNNERRSSSHTEEFQRARQSTTPWFGRTGSINSESINDLEKRRDSREHAFIGEKERKAFFLQIPSITLIFSGQRRRNLILFLFGSFHPGLNCAQNGTCASYSITGSPAKLVSDTINQITKVIHQKKMFGRGARRLV